MIYYGQKDVDGDLVCVGEVEEAVCIPEGCVKITKATYESWVTKHKAEREARAAARAEVPTENELLRADLDFLAALQGVIL